MIKILIVIVFIILAILVTSGAVGQHEPIGFKYWNQPGAFVNGAVGTVSVLLSAGFSFQGTEIGKLFFLIFFTIPFLFVGNLFP